MESFGRAAGGRVSGTRHGAVKWRGNDPQSKGRGGKAGHRLDAAKRPSFPKLIVACG